MTIMPMDHQINIQLPVSPIIELYRPEWLNGLCTSICVLGLGHRALTNYYFPVLDALAETVAFTILVSRN